MKSKDEENLAIEAVNTIIANTDSALVELNSFTKEVFQTRGGRIGSGMGTVIEALWGFFLNKVFVGRDSINYELGWIYGHEYNDFACVRKDDEWNPSTKEGELLRVEVKSMVLSADESKAHFDRLQHEFSDHELLVVFIWNWVQKTAGSKTVYPAVIDSFVGEALPIAQLRDELHLARGGTFVQIGSCPDGCFESSCTHVGEPLNASNVRERLSGPLASKGKNVSYAANFGGLLRMLGSRGSEGKQILKAHRKNDPTSARFIDFMARNYQRVGRALK